jgi:hypothetical protein
MDRLKVTLITSTPFLRSTERYEVQLNTETVPMWIVRLHLEIMATDQSDGIQSIPPVLWYTEGSTDIDHFGLWPLSRDADMWFTYKLLLRLTILHISLESCRKSQVRSSLPSNGNPHEANHQHFLDGLYSEEQNSRCRYKFYVGIVSRWSQSPYHAWKVWFFKSMVLLFSFVRTAKKHDSAISFRSNILASQRTRRVKYDVE